MGIDFSHCEAHWSYSGFMRFRERLMREIGIDLKQMEHFQMMTNEERAVIGKEPIYPMSWKRVVDPIVLLVNHSDCDGELSPEDCAKVASRLRELIDDWPDNDYNKLQARELADGMDAAAAANEPLVFQ